jgi:hypothetical protein
MKTALGYAATALVAIGAVAVIVTALQPEIKLIRGALSVLSGL